MTIEVTEFGQTPHGELEQIAGLALTDPHAFESILRSEFQKHVLAMGFRVRAYDDRSGERMERLYYHRQLSDGTREFIFPYGIGTKALNNTKLEGTYIVKVPTPEAEIFLRVVRESYEIPTSASIGAGIGLMGTVLGLLSSENLKGVQQGLYIGAVTVVSLVLGYFLGERASNKGLRERQENVLRELNRTNITVYKSSVPYDEALLQRVHKNYK